MSTSRHPVPLCFVSTISAQSISGWGVDGRTDQPLTFHVIMDGQEIAQVVCDRPLPSMPAGLDHPHQGIGFHLDLPSEAADGQAHRFEFRDIFRRVVIIKTDIGESDHLKIQEEFRLRFHSHVDGVRNGGFEGWVLRNSPGNDALQGSAIIRIACDELTIGHARADFHRGDVSKALSAPPNCGFRFVPPMVYLKPYEQTFRFFLMPENQELDESPLRTSFITDKEQAKLLALMDTVDKLYAQVTTVRRELGSIVSRQRHTIANYDEWFRRYEQTLIASVRNRQEKSPESSPLISVICPTYKPRLLDFQAAVQSVLDQSYQNWELIIVDDGSKNKELSAIISGFAKKDKRVKVVVCKHNAGISAATNAALAKAEGEWVAFFDHDDVLVQVALDMMMDAAMRTGAEMLYCDEDKLGENGIYSDPALKPAWNHRLMLGVNYVCHLLFVRKSRLDEVGELDSKLDGAQDHDMILRLSEVVPATKIHHVPEVLYHWRMTPQSTASSVSNKGYAVKAGITAVSHHLERLGREATVSSMLGITLYNVEWKENSSPKVTVIIPFKDEVETTLTCLKTLLDMTDYNNFDVILIDNWSTSPEYGLLESFVRNRKNVQIIRIEEEFNYSRLNNLAAAKTDAEFIVFMNNDLFVTKKNWLRASVNELLVDEAVGVVGGRFHYPNGTVQHAGVVLGIGGVAGHVHVGVPKGENGYAGRMLFPQEMSAVTAAGMVVRASAFRKVGGFDEVGLRVAFNDIDLCMKITQAGFKVIWTPEFEADHHESLSRGSDERPVQEARFFREIQVMKERWGDRLQNDPFYNKNFTLDFQPYFDLKDPEAAV